MKMYKRKLLTIFVMLLTAPILIKAEITQGDVFKLTLGLSSPQGQHNPRVAFDGNDIYLVVWEQGEDIYKNHYKQIYAARIQVRNNIATILDPNGIPLLTTTSSQQLPRVAYGNGVFLVVWQDLSSSNGFDIKGMRIDPDGNILDPSGIDISSGIYNEISPDLVYDPTNNRFFIVWIDYRSGTNYQVYGARIETNGYLSDQNGMLLSGHSYHITDGFALPLTPIVGTNGNTLLISWGSKFFDQWTSDLSVNKYDLDGNFLSEVFKIPKGFWIDIYGDEGLDSAVPEPLFKIVSDGQDFGFLFNALESRKDSKFYYIPFAKISENGSNNIQRPLKITPGEVKSRTAYSGDTAYIGETGFVVVWEESATRNDEHDPDRNIYLARVDKNMTTCYDADNPIVIVNTSSAEFAPAVASDENKLLIVWEEDNLADYPDIEDVIKGKVVTLGEIEISYECNDTIDNDGDGIIDLSDSGCDSETDDDETDCGDGICEGGEVCGTVDNFPECISDCGSCPSQCKSGADKDNSDSVSIQEVIIYIDDWKDGETTIARVIEAIAEWKSGC